MPGPGPGPKRFRLSDSGSLGCKYLKVCIVWGKDSVGERGSRSLGSRQREKKHSNRFQNVQYDIHFGAEPRGSCPSVTSAYDSIMLPIEG